MKTHALLLPDNTFKMIDIINREKPLTELMVARLKQHPTATHVIQSASGARNRVLKRDLVGFKLLGFIGGTTNQFSVVAVEQLGE